jgi:hypothetical protein
MKIAVLQKRRHRKAHPRKTVLELVVGARAAASPFANSSHSLHSDGLAAPSSSGVAPHPPLILPGDHPTNQPWARPPWEQGQPLAAITAPPPTEWPASRNISPDHELRTSLSSEIWWSVRSRRGRIRNDNDHLRNRIELCITCDDHDHACWKLTKLQCPLKDRST